MILSPKFLVSLMVFGQLSTAWASVEATIGPVPVDENENLAITMPSMADTEILISRAQYLLSYNKNHRAINWAAWKLEASSIGNSGRSNKFEQDADLEKYLVMHHGGHAVDPTEYRGSCFDRGHQVPSGDRTDSAQNNEWTFEMSNMIPQTPFLNRVIWEHFESYTRYLVQNQNKKAFIVAGPVYDEEFGAIGPNHDIAVPSKNFKIVFLLDANSHSNKIDAKTPYIAVLMPNVLKSGKKPTPEKDNCGGSKDETSSRSNDDWRQYQVTIEDIQNISGITFPL